MKIRIILDLLKKVLDIEKILENESKKRSKVLYYFVTFGFLILGLYNLFLISNLKELLGVVISIVILLFLLSRRKTLFINLILYVYVPLFMVSIVVTPVIGKPFFGILADNHSLQAFYDDFSKGLYQYSIGNYDGALSEYKKIKKSVPEDETLDFYLWYMDAAVRTKNLKLCAQLSKEVVQKIPNPTAEESRFLFQFIPVGNLINTYNEGDFEKLFDELSPYQSTDEEIIALFELAALARVDNSENQNRLESLLFRLPNCADTFDSYDYVKNSLLLETSLNLLKNSRYDLSTITLSELYLRNPALFFETFLWIYPTEYNLMNIRWISLDNLKAMRDLFHKGWIQLHENRSQLYTMYKESVTNLGLFLGITDTFQEAEEDFDCLKFDEILDGYSEHAMVYNILPLYEGKYLFIILEDEIFAEGNTDLPSMATQAYFYMLDSTSPVPIKPVAIDGSQLQISVLMGKLFLVQKLENSHKCLIVCIAGSGEYLSLWFLDVKTETLSSAPIDRSYHCSNFVFDSKNQHCNWNFEINNDLDSNMQTKVKGTVDALLDFNNETINTQISYADPALQLYAEERNEQLIFPLANLNRLGGREIKDEVLLNLIRNNCKPYYHYSQIQDTLSYMAEMYTPDVSGLEITYISDETSITSETSYFFLVKRKGEKLQILGMYKITDRGLKDVYKSSFLSKFISK